MELTLRCFIIFIISSARSHDIFIHAPRFKVHPGIIIVVKM